ncbi:MAG: putative metal-binding motif-containing protein [Deltaproteobacteria bacterium]|nr:putative metal-binding motif-containing protein [Deltaproteobacteria bacterium]
MAPRKLGTFACLCAVAVLSGCPATTDNTIPTDVPGEDAEGGEGFEVGDGEDGETADADGSCPGVPELCNGIDDDCDTAVDEDFDLSIDPENCGECGALCTPLHATGGCVDGACRITACDPGWVDANGTAIDGCEYECTATGEESTAAGNCNDLLDNDCDGRTDGTDGGCASCFPELCNSLDDDCDGLTDEDFDTDFDPMNCGACGRACARLPNAVPACVLGVCEFYCEYGWSDLDGQRWNGCEAECVLAGDPDETACNGIDNDCDGLTDEDFVPTPCGEGICVRDSYCHRGAVNCVPLPPPVSTDTTCNHLDDDCDGLTDEDADCRCYSDAECDDGNACNGPETCEIGVGCRPGESIDCGDGLDCTDDGCNALDGSCYHLPVHTRCSDGDACNGVETCDLERGCIAGTPVDCSDGITCTADSCDHVTGGCSHTPVDADCNDGVFCNGDEICDAARGCRPGTPPSCSDGVACTDDACNPATDTCVNTPIDSRCDDGQLCNGAERCLGMAGCQPGTPPTCDDGLSCTVDTCNPAGAGGAGACVNTPPDADGDTYAPTSCLGTDCNDSNAAIHPGAAERCNAIDDDCDTSTDETFACIRGSTGACMVGACDGSRVCSSSCVWGTCTVSATEICNGVDDTCNGVADEGFLCIGNSTQSCTVTRPTKTCTGSQTCTVPGCTWGTCVVPQDGSYAETCNNIDDDCDTTVDENPPAGYSLCPPVAHGTWNCTTGSCRIASCNSGYYDTNGTYADGCECALESTERPGTCNTATSLGTLTDSPTSSQTVTGKIHNATDVDCFSFSGSDVTETNSDSYHVDIRFTSNPSTQFQFTVWRGNCSTQVCTNETLRYEWYTDFRSGSGATAVGENPCRTTNTYLYNLCATTTATYYVCVSRRSGFTPTCDSYTIAVTNGVY